jgi:hypothetical protein
VLGPLGGVGLALGGIVTAIAEGDWVAAVVFSVPAALLALVAGRNAGITHAH